LLFYIIFLHFASICRDFKQISARRFKIILENKQKIKTLNANLIDFFCLPCYIEQGRNYLRLYFQLLKTAEVLIICREFVTYAERVRRRETT